MSIHEIDRAHAKLSASSSAKWLVCTPSAHIEDQIPDEDSPYAAEGTKAHDLFELKINAYLAKGAAKNKINRQIKNGGFEQDMVDYVDEAVARAIDLIELAHSSCKDPVIMVERRLDYSPWVPEGFGTGDLVIIADGLVDVADLKYGKGVPVSAQNNSQMRLYGLGAYNELNMLYDIKQVRMTVLQPRLDNYDSETLDVLELLTWADEVVVPKAALAWQGEGELVPGDHCSKGFCRARFTCPKRAESAQELVEASFAMLPPGQLTDDQMSRVLERADEVIKWLNDVKSWALKQAEGGTPVPGFKLVEGRSNRRYTNPEAVAKALTEAGIEEALIYERSLLGVTAMEKVLGKKQFADLVGNLIEKPQGKPTLVPESDKRPAFDSLVYFDNE